MTGRGQLVEVQAGGEEATFTFEQLGKLLELGKRGIEAITLAQRAALGAEWSLD
jgi:ribonuclease PH